MTTTTITLAQLCEQSNVPSSLIRAVVRQMGGWESFIENAPDICRGGIDGGFSGFIYSRDTEPFAKRNREAIAQMAAEQANDFGTGIFEMIKGFGCFRHGTKPTDEEIGLALYAGREKPDSVPILNALAWYAGEEVSRAYCNLTGYPDDPRNRIGLEPHVLARLDQYRRMLKDFYAEQTNTQP